MKILAHLSEHIAGFSKPCREAGHEWHWWEGIPAFDAFDQVQPDIAFLDQKLIDGATMKRIAEYEGGMPMVIAQEVGLELYFHFNNTVLSKAFTGVSVPAAVDTNTFYEAVVSDDMRCAIAVVCNPTEILRPLLFPVGKYDVRIYGPKWPNTIQYVGNLSVAELRTLYTSADLVYVEDAKEAVRVSACSGVAVSMNKNVDAALGSSFYFEDIEDLMSEDCECLAERMVQQTNVIQELSYYKILEQLKEKGLKL